MGKYREQFEELVSKTFKGKAKEDFLLLLDSFDRRELLFNALVEDFRTAEDLLKVQSQFNRRTFVRTSFAMIEGLINVRTQTVLEISKTRFFELSEDELEKITEQTIDKRPKFMPLAEKMKFSFGIFAQKVGGFDYSVNTKTKEWGNFKSTIRIRNQLMHPRTPKDLMLLFGSLKYIEN